MLTAFLCINFAILKVSCKIIPYRTDITSAVLEVGLVEEKKGEEQLTLHNRVFKNKMKL